MSTQHTTVIATDFEPRIIVQEDDGRWFRVLNWFYDEIVPGLTCLPLKIMLGMLRHRDNTTGLVARSRQQFAAELGISKGGLSAAFTTLTTHPAGLLAIRGSSLFEPLPGRTFAGRIIVPPGSAQRTEVRPSEPEFTPANSPLSDRARARPPKTLDKTQTTDQAAQGLVRECADPSGWSGSRPAAERQTHWPELSLWGEIARQRNDLRGVLADLGIRAQPLSELAAMPGLSIEQVLIAAAQVAHDPDARNKPGVLAGRLLGRKLPRGFEARVQRARLEPEEMAQYVNLERLRENHKRPHPINQEPAR